MSTASRPPVSPGQLTGSKEARRAAAVILEVLSGLRTPVEAAQVLGFSPPRYYQIEARGLQGLIDGLEPRSRGPRRRPEAELEALRKEKERLEQEVARGQALLRAAHRTIGIPKPARAKKKRKPGEQDAEKTSKRVRRPRNRAKQAIKVLRQDEPEASEPRLTSPA
jgi:hypothetical protein